METREAIDRIVELAAVQEMTIGGQIYTDRQIHRVIAPRPDPLVLFTLDSLIDYIKRPVDPLAEGTVVHVASPVLVQVVSPHQGDDFARNHYAVARGPACSFRFGEFTIQEQFVIHLQTMFSETEDRQNLLRLAGSITEQSIQTSADDGISQECSAKANIAFAERVTVKNPWVLAPYRTFREITQVASPFILRVRKGAHGPELALFEADGGRWTLDAINQIAGYLGAALPTDVTILH